MHPVNSEAIERALRLVKQEMGCVDARLEFGGRAPEAPEIIASSTPSGFRLVAIFPAPPEDRASASLRLRQLAMTFFDGAIAAPVPREDAEQQLAQRRLDDELCALSGRIGATGATVIDVQSPVIWGSSEGRNPEEDLETLLAVAQLDALAKTRAVDLAVVSGLREDDRTAALSGFHGEDRSRLEMFVSRMASRPLRARQAHLLHARALQQVRAAWRSHRAEDSSFRRLHHGQDLGYFARVFAGIYILVAYFPGPFSELRVEGSALHALPLIERHVLGLPPVDPDPPRGRVVKLQLPSP
jgi:hypothetical protein